MNLMSVASKITAAALLATLTIPLTQLGEADAGGRDRPGVLALLATAKSAADAVRTAVGADRDTISIDR